MRTLIRLTAAISTLLAFPAFAENTYEFDKEHTNIVFFVNHIGYSNMVGTFTAFDGSFTFDEKEPEKSTLNVTIDPKGVRTSSAKLDEHLQNEDFFNTPKFKDVRFVSKSVKVTGDKQGEIIGELTLLGVTKPVTLNVRFNKADYHPMSNLYVAGFSAETTIKRSEFGMDKYLPMVGDDVRILIETEGVNKDRKKAEEIKR